MSDVQSPSEDKFRDEVDRIKKENPGVDVFYVEIGGESFVFRGLTRSTYTQFRTRPEFMTDMAAAEDFVVASCILYP